MGLQSSGEISMSEIKTEVLNPYSTNILLAGGPTPISSSLFGLASSSVNKTSPHKMSEFYGYTHVQHGGGGGGPGGGGGGGGGFGGGFGGP